MEQDSNPVKGQSLVAAHTHWTPAPLRPEPEIDLRLATIDTEGRLRLRIASARMGWQQRRKLTLTVHGGVLRIGDDLDGFVGVEVPLDGRYRLQLPYGIRAATGFQPGTRLILLTVSDKRVVAAVPMTELIGRVAGTL